MKKRIFPRIILLTAFIFFPINGLAADPLPDTEIYLTEIVFFENGYSLKEAKNITNNPGYDNQPSFSGENIFYSSAKEGENTDIYLYNRKNGQTKKITDSEESEYSPILTPDEDSISVVRVEKDDSQILWKLSLKEDKKEKIIEDLKNIGYYAWLKKDLVALFLVGEPHSLIIKNITNGKITTVAENIGRSLQKRPGKNELVFVKKNSEKDWQISRFNLDDLSISPIIKTLEGSEDYTFTPSGILLMAKGSIIYKFEPGKDSEWLKIADFGKYGIKEIYRLAISPDGSKLAFVATK